MSESRSRSTFISDSRTAAFPVVTAADLRAATRSLVMPCRDAARVTARGVVAAPPEGVLGRDFLRVFRCLAILVSRSVLGKRRVVVVEPEARDWSDAPL